MTDCFFFSAEWMDGSSDTECLVNDSSVVFMQFVRSGAEWFKRQTNMGRPGSVMRACSFVLL